MTVPGMFFSLLPDANRHCGLACEGNRTGSEPDGTSLNGEFYAFLLRCGLKGLYLGNRCVTQGAT